jgi:hypothetical protein
LARTKDLHEQLFHKNQKLERSQQSLVPLLRSLCKTLLNYEVKYSTLELKIGDLSKIKDNLLEQKRLLKAFEKDRSEWLLDKEAYEEKLQVFELIRALRR